MRADSIRKWLKCTIKLKTNWSLSSYLIDGYVFTTWLRCCCDCFVFISILIGLEIISKIWCWKILISNHKNSAGYFDWSAKRRYLLRSSKSWKKKILRIQSRFIFWNVRIVRKWQWIAIVSVNEITFELLKSNCFWHYILYLSMAAKMESKFL